MKQLSLILAVVFVIAAILFWMGKFPAIPGIVTPGVHNHHSIGCLILALLCLVWYRFQSAAPAR
jgi:cytochrome b561